MSGPSAPQPPRRPVPPGPKGAAPRPALAPKHVQPAAAKPAAKHAARHAPPPAKPPEPAARDPLIGATLGRCRIEERIGVGRTATVYRAHHTALDTTVAVKVLLPAAKAVPEVVEKFATEARAIARIDNENVLKIFDVGQEGEQHFIVMELLDGDSILDVVAREGRLEPTDALRVTRQTANGLAAAHAAGIIHRDVKPQNLVLLQDGTVKVVDFGLAAGDETGSQRVGTPHYMAPEVCESGQAVPQSDVYSLGISLFHMLTGAPPFAGKPVKEILQGHIKGEALHPERKVPGLSRDVADLVRTLTKRDPLVRPTATQVLSELERIGGQELRKKDALRAKSARFRSRAQTQRAASPVPLIVLGVVVVGGVIALLAASGGKSEPSVTPAAPPPVVAPPGPTGYSPPVETPSAREARLKREAEAAAKKREADAAIALKGVETWIRANWHSKADDENVLNRYRTFKAEWRDTASAKEADERVRQIMAGKLHPHPDRSYGDAESVEATRARWTEARPEVERMIARGDYGKALALVPEAVEDAGGQLAVELRFWRMLGEHLVELQRDLAALQAGIPAGQRQVKLPDATIALDRISPGGTFEVKIDGAARRLNWDEVPAAEIARLARAAYQAAPKGIEARHHLLLMAFSWAHRLSDDFWGADLDLGSLSDAARFSMEQAAYKRGIEERLAGGAGR